MARTRFPLDAAAGLHRMIDMLHIDENEAKNLSSWWLLGKMAKGMTLEISSIFSVVVLSGGLSGVPQQWLRAAYFHEAPWIFVA